MRAKTLGKTVVLIFSAALAIATALAISSHAGPPVPPVQCPPGEMVHGEHCDTVD